MIKYLLDTSIIVFLFRGKHNIGQHLRKIGAENCYISEVTVAELTYGAYHSDHVQKNLEMIKRLTEIVHVIPFANAIDEYAKQKNRLIRTGKMIEDFDLLIGCSAVASDMIMVTDNDKHFLRIENIQIENWVKR